jgi:hypothetical protein
MSRFHSPLSGFVPLVFEDGNWTSNVVGNGKCPYGGDQSQVKWTAEYPLPQPSQNPIQPSPAASPGTDRFVRRQYGRLHRVQAHRRLTASEVPTTGRPPRPPESLLSSALRRLDRRASFAFLAWRDSIIPAVHCRNTCDPRGSRRARRSGARVDLLRPCSNCFSLRSMASSSP